MPRLVYPKNLVTNAEKQENTENYCITEDPKCWTNTLPAEIKVIPTKHKILFRQTLFVCLYGDWFRFLVLPKTMLWI